MPAPSRYLPLARWHRIGLMVLAVLLLAFGVLVEIRSAFLQRPLGDLLVNLRAAWAVRTGQDLYAMPDHNGWHYNLPPLLAILLTPLADPIPAVTDRAGYIPYEVTVALWYLFNLACLAWAVHTLARALEQTSAEPWLREQPPGCRSWWGLRLLPVLGCGVLIGHTLMRGQLNLLLLALLAGLAAATLRGHPFRAGLWLAGAICVKIIPAFLLLYPLWRRDSRCLLGCAAGLLVGLVLVPVAVFGPGRTADCYGDLARAVLLPALGLGDDQSRAGELIDARSTHSQSLGSTMHNLMFADPRTRPSRPAAAVRLAHWGLGALMTALTLLAAGWRRGTGQQEVLFLAALTLIMLLVCPVSHLHYFTLALPALMGLSAVGYERRQTAGPGPVLLAVAGGFFLASAAVQLPLLAKLRDRGVLTWATTLLWAVTVAALASGLPARLKRGRKLPAAAHQV